MHPAAAAAAGSSDWPALRFEEVASGIKDPTAIVAAGDGSGRLFLLEQPGRIRILQDGTLQAAPFLDIADRLVSGGEQGLLGLAFPADFSRKKHFYVDYTRKPDGATVVSRFRVAPDGSKADPGSEEVLLTVPQPYANHNGGQIAFGPDGFLYIGLGDGGAAGDPRENGQDPGTLLGTLLRLDVEGGAAAYAIPPGNPYAGQSKGRGEIWAIGLRNPWRFSFDRRTGDLYIADVGQNQWEEIDFQPAASTGGENYGWDILEGPDCYEPARNCERPKGYVPPSLSTTTISAVRSPAAMSTGDRRIRRCRGSTFSPTTAAGASGECGIVPEHGRKRFLPTPRMRSPPLAKTRPGGSTWPIMPQGKFTGSPRSALPQPERLAERVERALQLFYDKNKAG